MSEFNIITKRLVIRKSKATDEDIDFLFNLWTNPKVMVNVGFPNGLRITRDDVLAQMKNQKDSEYDVRLLVITKDTAEIIGECKLGWPDNDGVSETDVKLLPEFWGHKYGVEIKQALVDYLFTNTNCTAVKATPNKNNIASQKMQETVGGVRVDEGVFHFPERMQSYTVDVPYFEYRVFRTDWTRN